MVEKGKPITKGAGRQIAQDSATVKKGETRPPQQPAKPSKPAAGSPSKPTERK
jgi:hypothetical protein